MKGVVCKTADMAAPGVLPAFLGFCNYFEDLPDCKNGGTGVRPKVQNPLYLVTFQPCDILPY